MRKLYCQKNHQPGIKETVSIQDLRETLDLPNFYWQKNQAKKGAWPASGHSTIPSSDKPSGQSNGKGLPEAELRAVEMTGWTTARRHQARRRSGGTPRHQERAVPMSFRLASSPVAAPCLTSSLFCFSVLLFHCSMLEMYACATGWRQRDRLYKWSFLVGISELGFSRLRSSSGPSCGSRLWHCD